MANLAFDWKEIIANVETIIIIIGNNDEQKKNMYTTEGKENSTHPYMASLSRLCTSGTAEAAAAAAAARTCCGA